MHDTRYARMSKKSPNKPGSKSRVRLRVQEELRSSSLPSVSFSIVAENLSKMKDIVPPGTRFTGIPEESDEGLVDAESIANGVPERDGLGCSGSNSHMSLWRMSSCTLSREPRRNPSI